MSKRTLPGAAVVARPAARTPALPSAFERWNPGLRAADEPGTITILDVIGEDFLGEGVTARRIAGALRAIGDRPVVVDVNSPGGDFFEGLAIYNLLREHPHEVTVRVLGIAASAAAVIAMAGDRIEIARAGFLMIHNTWIMAMGDRNALVEAAGWLEPFDQAQASIFSARTGIPESDVAAMLDRETWIAGQAAIEQGFADDLLSSDSVKTDPAAKADPKVTLRHFDAVLAKAGMARSERRRLLGNLGGTQDAAPSGTQDAAAIASLLASLKNF